MVLIILEKIPASLRGELTRWMLEPKTGVFVGQISAMVRDKLWQKINEKMRDGAAMLVYSSKNEQGFRIQTLGSTSRHIHDWEGLQLVSIPSDGKSKKTESKKKHLPTDKT